MKMGFDVESVLEQLQECADNCERTAGVYEENHFMSKADKYSFGANCFRDAMEIVKKGGVR